MDLRQLRYFVEIADVGSFSRAGETLRIAQPSLSQQIRNLEDELGVELLTRHARGATLTELGQQFCDHSRRILSAVDRAKDVVQSQSANPSGRISVGLPTSAARNLSLPLYRAMARQQPGVELHIVEAMSGYLDDLVQTGRIDVALLYDHHAHERVAWTESITEDLMLFVPVGSPLARRTEIAFNEIFEHRLVLPGRPHVLRAVVERLAARQDVLVSAVDCDSLPAISTLVRNEGYCAIMPHFAFLEDLQRAEIAAIPIVDPTPFWRLSVLVSQRTLNARGSEAVAYVLAEVIAQLVEGGVWKGRIADLSGTATPERQLRRLGG